MERLLAPPTFFYAMQRLDFEPLLEVLRRALECRSFYGMGPSALESQTLIFVLKVPF
jgi:hypothetical protein